MPKHNNDTVIDKKVDTEKKLEKPKKFACVIHNDNYSTMQTVVDILQKVFHKSPEEAEHLMLEVHMHGKTIAGIYTFEVAETKAYEGIHMARTQKEPEPLNITVEPVEV